jgi:hypothetical protein
MKVLLIGTGGVGEAIAIIAQDKPWLKKMVLADSNTTRLKEVSTKLNDPKRYPVERLDARDKKSIVKLARDYNVDLIMNAVDPVFNETIRRRVQGPRQLHGHGHDAVQAAQVRSLRRPASKLLSICGRRKRRPLALVGMASSRRGRRVRPLRREALFDEIDEIGVRDGSNIEARLHLAPNFDLDDD